MTDAPIPPTTILVSDTGFHNNTQTIDFATELGPEVRALDLASDTDPNPLPDLSHAARSQPDSARPCAAQGSPRPHHLRWAASTVNSAAQGKLEALSRHEHHDLATSSSRYEYPIAGQ